MAGNRLDRTLNTSRIAAPLGEVITPILLGNLGGTRFRSASKRPSKASLLLSSSNRRRNSPSPASSR